MNHTLVETQTSADILVSDELYEDRAIFGVRFWRSQRLLYLVASRILHSDEEVEAAIHNCWVAASCNPPRFESEGAFRSWLLRLLINEAAVIIHNRSGSCLSSGPN
jgi:DNA-directed RNA polymerase specialized sigma24 family protein